MIASFGLGVGGGRSILKTSQGTLQASILRFHFTYMFGL